MRGNHTIKRIQKSRDDILRETGAEKKRRKRNNYHCYFIGCATRVTQKMTLMNHYKRKHGCSDEDAAQAYARTGKELICNWKHYGEDGNTRNCSMCESRGITTD